MFLIRKKIKWIACLTLFFLMSYEFGGNRLWAASIAGGIGSELSVKTEFNLSLPGDLGTIENRVSGTGPAIVHIQEAHGHYESQKQIEKILTFLKEKYDIKLVLLEGDAFKLHPELSRFFSENSAYTQQINEELLKKGVTSGPAVFLAGHQDTQGYGIENLETYLRNGQAFKEVLEAREESSEFLDRYDLLIKRMSAPYLDKPLRHFLTKQEDFENGMIPLDEWLHILDRGAKHYLNTDLSNPKFQKDWPMILRVMMLQKFEAKIDLYAFEKEKNDFLADLSRYFPVSGAGAKDSLHPKIKNLLDQKLTHAELSAGQTGEVVERMVSHLPRDFHYGAYPNVALFIGHLVLQSEIDPKRLFDEISLLTGKISGVMAGDDPLRHQIIERINRYRLLKKLFRLELTAGEYEQLIQPGPDGVLPTVLLEEFRRLSASQQTELPEFEKGEAVDDLYQRALEFYRGAKARDDLMLKNIEKRMIETGEKKAVVITGGFHSGPFQDYFQRKNYHYALITPSIKESEPTSDYSSSILQNYIAPLKNSTSTYRNVDFTLNTPQELAWQGRLFIRPYAVIAAIIHSVMTGLGQSSEKTVQMINRTDLFRHVRGREAVRSLLGNTEVTFDADGAAVVVEVKRDATVSGIEGRRIAEYLTLIDGDMDTVLEPANRPLTGNDQTVDFLSLSNVPAEMISHTELRSPSMKDITFWHRAQQTIQVFWKAPPGTRSANSVQYGMFEAKIIEITDGTDPIITFINENQEVGAVFLSWIYAARSKRLAPYMDWQHQKVKVRVVWEATVRKWFGGTKQVHRKYTGQIVKIDSPFSFLPGIVLEGMNEVIPLGSILEAGEKGQEPLIKRNERPELRKWLGWLVNPVDLRGDSYYIFLTVFFALTFRPMMFVSILLFYIDSVRQNHHAEQELRRNPPYGLTPGILEQVEEAVAERPAEGRWTLPTLAYEMNLPEEQVFYALDVLGWPYRSNMVFRDEDIPAKVFQDHPEYQISENQKTRREARWINRFIGFSTAAVILFYYNQLTAILPVAGVFSINLLSIAAAFFAYELGRFLTAQIRLDENETVIRTRFRKPLGRVEIPGPVLIDRAKRIAYGGVLANFSAFLLGAAWLSRLGVSVDPKIITAFLQEEPVFFFNHTYFMFVPHIMTAGIFTFYQLLFMVFNLVGLSVLGKPGAMREIRYLNRKSEIINELVDRVMDQELSGEKRVRAAEKLAKINVLTHDAILALIDFEKNEKLSNLAVNEAVGRTLRALDPAQSKLLEAYRVEMRGEDEIMKDVYERMIDKESALAFKNAMRQAGYPITETLSAGRVIGLSNRPRLSGEEIIDRLRKIRHQGKIQQLLELLAPVIIEVGKRERLNAETPDNLWDESDGLPPIDAFADPYDLRGIVIEMYFDDAGQFNRENPMAEVLTQAMRAYHDTVIRFERIRDQEGESTQMSEFVHSWRQADVSAEDIGALVKNLFPGQESNVAYAIGIADALIEMERLNEQFEDAVDMDEKTRILEIIKTRVLASVPLAGDDHLLRINSGKNILERVFNNRTEHYSDEVVQAAGDALLEVNQSIQRAGRQISLTQITGELSEGHGDSEAADAPGKAELRRELVRPFWEMSQAQTVMPRAVIQTPVPAEARIPEWAKRLILEVFRAHLVPLSWPQEMVEAEIQRLLQQESLEALAAAAPDLSEPFFSFVQTQPVIESWFEPERTVQVRRRILDGRAALPDVRQWVSLLPYLIQNSSVEYHLLVIAAPEEIRAFEKSIDLYLSKPEIIRKLGRFRMNQIKNIKIEGVSGKRSLQRQIYQLASSARTEGVATALVTGDSDLSENIQYVPQFLNVFVGDALKHNAALMVTAELLGKLLDERTAAFLTVFDAENLLARNELRGVVEAVLNLQQFLTAA